MRILVSNDDGIYARGIHVLAKALGVLGDVWVVAPIEEQSTKGHSLTLYKPLRTLKLGPRTFGVSGTPADCISVAIGEIMRSPPDLVVSGINRGANLGQDIFYSGTVAAAREASICGFPSFAVSLDVSHKVSRPEDKLHYQSAASIAVKIIRDLIKQTIPEHTLVNINVPDLALRQIKGIRVARQGFRHYSGNLLKRRDHRGRDYFWVGGRYMGFRKEDGSDCTLVDKRFATVTPLKLDTTDFQFLRTLTDKWSDD